MKASLITMTVASLLAVPLVLDAQHENGQSDSGFRRSAELTTVALHDATGYFPRTVLSSYRIPYVDAPAAPFNLTANALNTYQIHLHWQEAPGQNQTGFNVYRCRGCSNPRTQGERVASVGAGALSYRDGSKSHPLRESKTYRYQVTAFDGSGESGPSNTASATTETEPAPTNLTSFAFGRGNDDIVNLSWTNNATDDDSYHVERCAGSACTNFLEIAKLAANVTTYRDLFEFAHGQTFRYRVRAHSPGGYSAYSNIRTQKLP